MRADSFFKTRLIPQRAEAFTIASFLSAFLLFLIQPVAAKVILPLFGGSNLVWASCMAFFQGTLLLGYVYAHVMQRWLGVKKYASFHWILLLITLIYFPFPFSQTAPEPQGWMAFFSIIRILIMMIGLPFLTLSTTSLILQRWLSVSRLPGRQNPYSLYSASNLGSFLALLSYPILIEPAFDIEKLGRLWWYGYFILIVAHIFCFPGKSAAAPPQSKTHKKVSLSLLSVWVFLSAAACATLLATTNIITFDMASVPFLWVLPLALYLLSFVFTFKKKPWYPSWIPSLTEGAMIIAVAIYVLMRFQKHFPVWFSVPLYLVIMFLVCLHCHGKLIATRPENHRNLTTFYICLSLGGLLGSVFVSFIIPCFSTSTMEYLAAFLLTGLALGLADRCASTDRNISEKSIEQKNRKKSFSPTLFLWPAVIVLGMTLLPWGGSHLLATSKHILRFFIIVLLCVSLWKSSKRPWSFALAIGLIMACTGFAETQINKTSPVLNLRNFYGIYSIFDKENIRYLKHGTTIHGTQYLSGSHTHIPLSYYHPSTPVGEILTDQSFSFQKIAMVGLGPGALASYLGDGQSLTIYELDPDGVRIAEEYFSYLAQARQRKVSLNFIIGDGRISLRREPAGIYDLLMIDAFTSDAIPVHLMTVEAVQEYMRVLKPGGLLLMHISNKMLSLEPIIFSIAQELNIAIAIKTNVEHVHKEADSTTWVVLSKDRMPLQYLYQKKAWFLMKEGTIALPRPWTDRYSNLFKAMRFDLPQKD